MARPVTPRAPADHLARVPGFLRAARLLFGERLWEQAASDAYYATFHTASALLASIGVTASTHAGTQQALSLHFIRRGPLPPQLGRLYSHLLNDRGLADCGLAHEIDEAAAREALGAAAMLLRAMLALLADHVPEAAALEPDIAALEAGLRPTPPG